MQQQSILRRDNLRSVKFFIIQITITRAQQRGTIQTLIYLVVGDTTITDKYIELIHRKTIRLNGFLMNPLSHLNIFFKQKPLSFLRNLAVLGITIEIVTRFKGNWVLLINNKSVLICLMH